MPDYLFQLPQQSDANLQSQVREMLVTAILDGHIPAGSTLPSCRRLATQLGVSRNTVVLAYERLVAEGFLVSRERSGYYVNADILEGQVALTKRFRGMLRDAGTKPLRLPARSPNLNAHCERFVLSIKSECLSRLILFSEAQLHRAVDSYVEHYHRERNHQGLGNRLLDGRAPAANEDGKVRCSQRLGGLLRYYHRDAA